MDHGVVYTSAKGQLRAFDDATGALKWTSADFGAAVAETQIADGMLYGAWAARSISSTRRRTS